MLWMGPELNPAGWPLLTHTKWHSDAVPYQANEIRLPVSNHDCYVLCLLSAQL